MLGLITPVGLPGKAADKMIGHSKLRVKQLGCALLIMEEHPRTNPAPHVLRDNEATFGGNLQVWYILRLT